MEEYIYKAKRFIRGHTSNIWCYGYPVFDEYGNAYMFSMIDFNHEATADVNKCHQIIDWLRIDGNTLEKIKWNGDFMRRKYGQKALEAF